MEEVKVNKYGTNCNIKAHLLNDKEMRKIGFSDYSKDTWYFMRMLNTKYEISFGVSINKKDVNDLRIDVLDENFCQPYDYQSMLEKNPNFKPCLEVKEKVEKWMTYLQEQGVLSGHVNGEYI